MTTYNGGRYLREQLESFSAQTRLPDELVVCDDGSKDDTLAVLEDFARSAPFPVRIFRNPKNLGFIRNFEQVISRCTGELVFLSDQDDVWLPGKIAAVEAVFREHPDVAVVVHDGELVDENLLTHGATKLQQVVRGFGSTDSLVMGALTAVRRSLLGYILPFPPEINGHDIWIHRVGGLLQARYVLPEKLQLIRRHGLNTSNWVASSVKSIGKLDVWQSQYRSPVATSYEDRISFNDACRGVLERIEAEETAFSRQTTIKARQYLEAERRALLARDALVKTRGLRQKVMSVRLLCRGDYRFFNGYMSFLRDVTR
jgi:glycosyltransferase involved in cell wall biosynthesis